MDIKLNTNVSSSQNFAQGKTAELQDKAFMRSLGQENNISDVKNVEDSAKLRALKDKETAESKRAAREQELKEEAKEAVDGESTEELVKELNTKNLGLTFTIDKELDRTLINVMDKDTDDLVRQIPSEEFLRVVKSIHKYQEAIAKDDVTEGNKFNQKEINELKGIILDDKA